MREQSFIFKHFNKFFTGMLILIFVFWVAIIVAGVKVASEIGERGLKDLLETVWEGPTGE